GREAPPVAGAAHAVDGVTGEHRSDVYGSGAGLDELRHELVADLLALRGDLLPVDLHVLGQYAAERSGVHVRVLDVFAGRRLHGDSHREAAIGLTVVLADDDLLRDVDEPPGQVARVGGPQRGVGEPLAGAVGRDEVLEHRQPLAEVRLDRPRDDLALRVRHEAAHPGDLSDLHDVPTRTGVGHHVDGVVLRELRLHGVLDLVGGLR